MSRISIDVSPEEHRKLKAIAALKGKTMKDYLLEGKIDLGRDEEIAARMKTVLNGSAKSSSLTEVLARFEKLYPA